MKKLIAGNWKMNNTLEQSVALASGIVSGIRADRELAQLCDFAVFPPFVHLTAVKSVLDPAVVLGAQDCSAYAGGAYTGDVSATMLADMDCGSVIVGHSERRQHFGESDSDILNKVSQAHGQGIQTILCVGESEAEREAGRERDVVGTQLAACIPPSSTADNLVIAYEPVWAIGTGKAATGADIEAMHGFIREKLAEKLAGAEKVRILYGGSVKPGNAAEVLSTANVDGALVGGASLKAEDFLGIAGAAKR